MIPPLPDKKCSLFALSTLGHLLYSDVFEGEEMMQVPAQSGRWSCQHFLLFPHNCFFHSIFSPPHDNPSDEFVFLLVELIITLALFFSLPRTGDDYFARSTSALHLFLHRLFTLSC
jgi:hypothetical protein